MEQELMISSQQNQAQYSLVHIWLISPSAAYMRASVNRVSIGSDNGLSPIWRQAII